ncbi:MAG TPA: GNAT family N-acetyltransferase, partial [Flavobacteriaceae bacterium]|nr:GNAT family N-acetyltransferase [Flavobacteriaceae bacterium]
AFQKDLDREELYVFEQEGNVLGAVVISDFKDLVYEPVQWMCATG